MPRTKSLAAFTATTPLSTVTTVPALKTWIVKSITVYNSGALPTTVTLALKRGATDYEIFKQVVGAGALVNTLPYVVMVDADLLRCAGGATGVRVVVSGTELDGVAP